MSTRNQIRSLTAIIKTISIAALMLLVSCENNPFGDDNGVAVYTRVYPEIDQNPAWSADGSVIAYYHNGTTLVRESGSYHCEIDSIGLWFIAPTGDGRRQFLQGDNRWPAWSPDGEWLAFVNGAQIYKIKSNGDSLIQLTDDGSNFFPTYSPDGMWIAYDNTSCGSMAEPAPPNSCGLFIIESSGSERKFVMGGRMPDWSPDGDYLIYIGLAHEIYRVNINDSLDIVQLTSFSQNNVDHTDNRCPKYSPDGSRIAFSSDHQIWVMDADGTNLLQLTQNGGTYPAWSTDGSQIVFTRHDGHEFSDENGHLGIMDANGRNKRQLTFRNY